MRSFDRVLVVLLLVLARDAAARVGSHECRAAAKDGEFVGEFYGTFPTCTYKGIPYATPPVGKLRFMPTRPVPPLKRPFQATRFGPGCIQKCNLQHPEFTCPKNTSEDCLSLNVYTPRTADSAKTGLPVMVFFHGGNYIIGTGGCGLYHGSRWAHDQEVIIVTVNYRLGVFGGLYTKRAGVNGNFQLMDQRESMRWVQRNIAAFGGDPSMVTIFGQSAGGFSVASHLASPKSWPYFQRAIVHSDPLALPTEHESKLKIISDEVVKKLGCDKFHQENDELQCLQSVSADQVLLAQRKSSFPVTRGVLHAFMPWTPVVTRDDELPMSPLEAARTGRLPKGVSIMTGTVANESVQFIWKASPKPLPYDEFVLYIESIFGIVDAGKLFKMYGKPPKEQIDNGDVRDFMSDVGTDYIFTCPNKRFGKDASRVNPDTYLYYFNHLLSYNEFFQGEWHPECRGWICHGSELPLLFGTEFLEPMAQHPSPTFKEEVLSSQMRTIWANFAKTGNPNRPVEIPTNTGKPFPEILPLTENTDPTIAFQTQGTEIRKGFIAEACFKFDKIGYEKN